MIMAPTGPFLASNTWWRTRSTLPARPLQGWDVNRCRGAIAAPIRINSVSSTCRIKQTPLPKRVTWQLQTPGRSDGTCSRLGGSWGLAVCQGFKPRTPHRFMTQRWCLCGASQCPVTAGQAWSSQPGQHDLRDQVKNFQMTKGPGSTRPFRFVEVKLLNKGSS